MYESTVWLSTSKECATQFLRVLVSIQNGGMWPPFSQGTWSQFHVQSFFSGCQCKLWGSRDQTWRVHECPHPQCSWVSPSIKGETRQLAKSRKPIWWIRVWLANFLVICESAIMMVRPGSSGEEWIVWEPPLKIQIIERRGSFERLSSGSSQPFPHSLRGIGFTFHVKRY